MLVIRFFTIFLIAVVSYSARAQWDPNRCFKKNLVGKWEGVVETSSSQQHYEVSVEFLSDGTYGIDGQRPHKKYKVESVAEGVGEVTIEAYFSPTVVKYKLRDVRMFGSDHETDACDESGEAEFLEFKMHHLKSYGTLEYKLRRSANK